MSIKEFKLPDPGEGLTEAEIVTWRVAVGDEVKVNDIVVEIETAKSLVELPVPFAGRVEALLAAEGTEVAVGTPIIAIQTDIGAASTASPSASAPVAAHEPGLIGSPAPKVDPAVVGEPAETIEEGKIGGKTASGRTAVLVGYGVRETEATRRPRKGLAPAPPQPAAAAGPRSTESLRQLAKPPVRKLAKDNGVDLAGLNGSGEGGIITRADVEAAVGSGSEPAAYAPGAVSTAGPGMPFAPGARGESRTPIKGVRKATAAAMVESAFTAPHVTEWVTVDVSATMDLVDQLKRDKEFRDVKVTPLLILAKAMCLAVRRHPGINVAWDEDAQEIVTKNYVNLGIAAATPRGLIVPNIKDADLMPLVDLGRAINDLTATAREGRTQPADQTGGTITITNVGVFGVDTGTPILNRGEAAIVAFGAVRRMPWVVTAADGSETIAPRWVTQLGMSFDHRLVDGELGSRYLADVAAILEDPARALVWA